MSSLKITGGHSLKGTLTIAGNKNAVLKVLPATLLTDEPSTIENVPDIQDVATELAILEDLGAQVERPTPDTVKINPRGVHKSHLNPNLVAKLRASIIFMGPLLARFGEVKLRHPGGCLIGRRPVDVHFQAIRDFGGQVTADKENFIGKFKSRQSHEVFLTEASVTATENLMMLAAKTPGSTVILDAACEPHVANLADMLNSMGARITGAGTNRIEIQGTPTLHGTRHRISPDFMEAGTFAILAAATRSHLIIKNALRQDFHMIFAYLQHFGVNLKFLDDRTLEIKPSSLHTPQDLKEIQARPWPGFPADLMSPLIVLGTQAQGATLFHDWMYESRMFFADKLIAMGARITMCDPHRIVVTGPTPLRGKTLDSPDIRAGIALVIAALIAPDQSLIHHAEIISRGYQNLAQRLKNLGAHIEEIGD
jgi:UDP-N-acetylglucosamine 1-carboxyvinyltransferase